jgi:hypothetical protein
MNKDWVKCETRLPWVRNSLKVEIAEFRRRANKTRKAYQNDFMGSPCRYIADAYDEAADALQKRLDELN